jgi:hypothetical protein
MNFLRPRAISALQILIPLIAIVSGSAYAADSPDITALHLTAVNAGTALNMPRARLDLRVPELRRVMSGSQLLAEMGASSEDAESIQIVAEPVLVPMSFDAQAPLGIIDSLHWSVDHPTQAWRILLPVVVTP